MAAVPTSTASTGASATFLRAATAVTLVWWMLIGGAYWASIGLFTKGTVDATILQRMTWILWDLVWAAIGIACLWGGGKLLLTP